MNKHTLTLAAAMAAPMATQAEITISDTISITATIQAEIVNWEVANGNENAVAERVSFQPTQFEDMDRQTLSKDYWGSILNEGPNHIQFDFDEKLADGLTAEARYAAAFSTVGNFLSNPIGQETWLGFKTDAGFHMRYGTLTGVYKSSHKLIDPWAFTSLQSRGTGGGMSGDHYIKVSSCDNTYCIITDESTNGLGLTNEGWIEGAFEIGIKSSGFSAKVQGVVDDASEMERAGLVELRFTAPHFGVWLAGSFADLELKGMTNENSTNWKIGGYYHFGKLTFGLQYENAEIGTLDNNPEGGTYILGSLDFTKNNVTIAGWVAGYLSDIEDRMPNEDALSWAIGAKYHFSKRTQIYVGYRETNSDNDFRDENVATFGIKHVF